MTACILDHHAIGRRQYALLMQRELRRTQREMRRISFFNVVERALGCAAFFFYALVLAVAFLGWLGV